MQVRQRVYWDRHSLLLATFCSIVFVGVLGSSCSVYLPQLLPLYKKLFFKRSYYMQANTLC